MCEEGLSFVCGSFEGLIYSISAGIKEGDGKDAKHDQQHQNKEYAGTEGVKTSHDRASDCHSSALFTMFLDLIQSDYAGN